MPVSYKIKSAFIFRNLIYIIFNLYSEYFIHVLRSKMGKKCFTTKGYFYDIFISMIFRTSPALKIFLKFFSVWDT